MRDHESNFRAAAIGDMVPTNIKPAQAMPGRRCPFCQAIMSRYNLGDSCWPCETKATGSMRAAASAVLPVVLPKPKPGPKEPNRIGAPKKAYQQFLDIVAATRGNFTANELAAELDACRNTAYRYLVAAQRDGLVELVRRERSTQIWRRKGEAA